MPTQCAQAHAHVRGPFRHLEELSSLLVNVPSGVCWHPVAFEALLTEKLDATLVSGSRGRRDSANK